MLRKGHGGLHKAPTKEESERLRGEGDQIKCINLRLKDCQRMMKGTWFGHWWADLIFFFVQAHI